MTTLSFSADVARQKTTAAQQQKQIGELTNALEEQATEQISDLGAKIERADARVVLHGPKEQSKIAR